MRGGLFGAGQGRQFAMALAIEHARLTLLSSFGAARLAHRLGRSPGVIFRLQRVLPLESSMSRAPGALCVTPHFLHRFVNALRRWGYDIVSLDQLHRRLEARQGGARMACLTFDGGYGETYEYAFPVLRALNAPFAVYLDTNFADHLGEAWWLAIDAVAQSTKRLALVADNREYQFVCADAEQKRAVTAALREILWSLPRDSDIRFAVRDLCSRYGVDLAQFNRLFMTWDHIRTLASDPLVTIGASSVSAPILAKLPAAQARREMDMSRSVIEAALGVRPSHYAYPFGTAFALDRTHIDMARSLGFATAVTTRQSILKRDAAQHLHALPRLNVGGSFAALRYLRLFASGAVAPRQRRP